MNSRKAMALKIAERLRVWRSRDRLEEVYTSPALHQWDLDLNYVASRTKRGEAVAGRLGGLRSLMGRVAGAVGLT